MAPKRRLQKRAQAVGAQVEASIREDGEQHRFQAAASEQLFTVDSKGGVDHRLTKKQKMMLLQKDPLVKSRKFDASKASKSMLATVQKLKAQPVQTVAPLTMSAADSNVVAKVWGSDGAVAPPAELALLDEYVAPAVVKKVKRRQLVAPTAHNIPKVQVAAPGQSYHPEFAAHQDVLAEAVAKELERRETLAEMSQPVGAGMSEEVLQHINTRGSDDESESDDDADTDAPVRKKKASQVVTRSQRNKRSRHKQMELEHLQRRQEKTIIKQINAYVVCCMGTISAMVVSLTGVAHVRLSLLVVVECALDSATHILQDIIRDEKTAEQRQELKKVLEEQKFGAEPELVRVGGKLTYVLCGWW